MSLRTGLAIGKLIKLQPKSHQKVGRALIPNYSAKVKFVMVRSRAAASLGLFC